MVPNAWHAAPELAWVGSGKPVLKFDDRYEGFPDGIMTVNEAVAVSNGAHFASGTIDFDIKPLAWSYTGVIFRRDADGNGEFSYLRGDPDCPASNDCYQYTPVNHGMLQWNVYSNYQGPAPIQPSGWNHVHIVVADEKMAVFLNHADRPILVVPKLRGLTAQGGIGFKGAAIYANLVIDPGMPSLADVKAFPRAPDTLTDWPAAPPVAWPTEDLLPASDG